MFSKLSVLTMVGTLAVTVAFADDDDPPGRAARLSYVDGTVSMQPSGVEEWVPGEVNRPLTSGDRIWTEGGARAELQLGSAAVRLNERTNSSLINLDDLTAQIEVSLG